MFSQVDWLAIVSQVGIPGAMLAAVLFGIYKLGTWAAKELIVPLRDKWFTFFDNTIRVNQQNADNLARFADIFETLHAAPERDSRSGRTPTGDAP